MRFSIRTATRLVALVIAASIAGGCQLPSWWPGADVPPPAEAPTASSTTTTTTTTSSTTTTTTIVPPAAPTVVSWCASGTAPGPGAPPAGAVTIRTTDDAAAVAAAHGAGTTYWFAPGTHSPSTAIDAQRGDTYVGAPGAALDGGARGVPAFTGGGTDVTIAHLTIENFGTPDGHGWVNGSAVNRSVAARWTVTDSTIRHNDGNGLFLGDGSTTRRNCFEDNGQTGLAAPAQQRNGAYVSLHGIVVSDNDVRDNNRNDLESAPGACSGCTGGMKLWQTTGAVVSGNVVAGNHGVGIWLDNDNVDALVAANAVTDNDREGIMVETSYNSRIVGNVVARNAIVDARRRGTTFPIAGIFVSNSGGSSRLDGPVGIEVGANRVEDNWNGVVVYWDADRYCGSAADTSVGHCTLGGATPASCASLVDGRADLAALVDECHWTSEGVRVHDNEFSTSAALSASCARRCGRNGLIASTAPATTRLRAGDGSTRSIPNPLAPDWAQRLVADPTTNRFWSNTYRGTWTFELTSAGHTVDAASWQASGHDAP